MEATQVVLPSVKASSGSHEPETGPSAGLPFLSPTDVALRLNVTRRMVYRLIDAGLLPARKIGSRIWRIAPQDLQAYVEASLWEPWTPKKDARPRGTQATSGDGLFARERGEKLGQRV
jgi:excisionase family DNA binding protein